MNGGLLTDCSWDCVKCLWSATTCSVCHWWLFWLTWRHVASKFKEMCVHSDDIIGKCWIHKHPNWQSVPQSKSLCVAGTRLLLDALLSGAWTIKQSMSRLVRICLTKVSKKGPDRTLSAKPKVVFSATMQWKIYHYQNKCQIMSCAFYLIINPIVDSNCCIHYTYSAWFEITISYFFLAIFP